MTKRLVLGMTILLVASFALMADDVSGQWIWTVVEPGRGRPARRTVFTLKADGTKLTGSVSGLGRPDKPLPPAEITDGKVDGTHVWFTVKLEVNGDVLVVKYDAVILGDQMILKRTRTGENGKQVTDTLKLKRSPA